MEHDRLKERARDITWETQYESDREEATSGFEPLDSTADLVAVG